MKTEKNIFFPIDLSVLRIDEVNTFNFYIKTGPANNEYVLYSKKALFLQKNCGWRSSPTA